MITLLHFNDLHGAVEMLPWLAALIARERQRHAHVLLLDAGDLALAGQTADLGIQLLRNLHFDALTTGNAENEKLEYRTSVARIGAPIVVANVAPGELGVPTVPYLLRDADGIRIAILGLTTPPVYPRGHALERPGGKETPVDDPISTAREWVPRLRTQADLLIVLSHLGLWKDTELARAVPGIDLIVGSHSHHRLQSLLRIGKTHIAQAGVGGAYLGVIIIHTDGDGFSFNGRLEPVWQLVAADKEFQRITHAYLEHRLPAALARLGETTGCWGDPWQESPWADYVTDHLRGAGDAEICFYKAAGIIPALDRGPVTRWDLLRCLPVLSADPALGWGELVRMRLSGAAIREICEHSVSGLPCEVAEGLPRQLCLPGNTFLQHSGLRVVYDLGQPPGQRVTSLCRGTAPINPDQWHTVVTTGFLAKGYSGFHWFRDGLDRKTIGREEQIISEALQADGSLPPIDGRLQFVGGDSALGAAG